jgi:hypothetical protein
MSQHKFLTACQGKAVNVLLGWDRPMQCVFMVIFEPIYRDPAVKIIYSYLKDDKSQGQRIDYYAGKLKELGIVVPQQMLFEVIEDCANDVGNRYCEYRVNGTHTDSMHTPFLSADMYDKLVARKL